jgi:hypothetical protein
LQVDESDALRNTVYGVVIEALAVSRSKRSCPNWSRSTASPRQPKPQLASVNFDCGTEEDGERLARKLEALLHFPLLHLQAESERRDHRLLLLFSSFALQFLLTTLNRLPSYSTTFQQRIRNSSKDLHHLTSPPPPAPLSPSFPSLTKHRPPFHLLRSTLRTWSHAQDSHSTLY